MAKRKTNIQVVNQMMEFSQHGALAQLFILQAIEKYADACIAAKPEEMENGFISGVAWQGVAKDLKRQLNEHYGVETKPKLQTLGEMEKENTDGFRNKS